MSVIEHDPDENEMERLRSDAWKWRHLAADAAAALNRREREITRLEAQLQGAVRERDTALVDRARLVAEVERLRSENERLHRQLTEA